MALAPFIFSYGNYVHAAAEVKLSINKKAIPSARGLRQLVREIWRLDGILQSTDGTILTLTSQIQVLQNAYGFNSVSGAVTGAADFQNATLVYNDGSGATAHQLLNGNSLSGVRVTGFEWKEGDGEYTTYRSYSITLQADFVDATNNLLSFKETVAFKGSGGPRFVWLDTLEDGPVQQLSASATTIHCVQSGSAIGLLSYVSPPAPLYPAIVEHLDQREGGFESPDRIGQGLMGFHTTWKYSFESPELGLVLPHNP